MSKGNLIYSRRFPSLLDLALELGRELEQEAKLLNESMTEEERADHEEDVRRFNEWLNAERVYIPIPEKITIKDRFISLAKELSEDFLVNMDIWEKKSGIEIELYLPETAYGDYFNGGFGRLIATSDTMSISARKEENSLKFTLGLETHECRLAHEEQDCWRNWRKREREKRERDKKET